MDREKIAHDLTIVYLRNRYGIDVSGTIDDSGGWVESKHFPSTIEAQYVKVGTGEKGLFGREKKQKVQDGYLVDNILTDLVRDYKEAYERIYNLLGE